MRNVNEQVGSTESLERAVVVRGESTIRTHVRLAETVPTGEVRSP